MWYKKLGFDENPFSIKPAAFRHEMIAYDLDYIYQKIKKNEILFIEGEYGSGKTTILKNIINEFRGKHKIIYFSFISGKKFNLKKLLEGANSFFDRLSGKKIEDVILLLDEVQEMKKSEAAQVLKAYMAGQLKSVALVNHDYDAVKVPSDMKDYLKDNVLRTVPLTQKEALELVDDRIGDIDLIPKKIILKIFRLSGKNPRRFLEYCEDVARCAVETEDFRVNKFHLETALGDVLEEENKKKHDLRKEKAVEKKKEQKKEEEAEAAEEVSEAESRDQPEETEEKSEEPETEEESEERPAEEKKEPGDNYEEIEGPGPEEEEKKSRYRRKYKVNKHVDSRKDKLGKIEANEDFEEVPEYKVFVFDD